MNISEYNERMDAFLQKLDEAKNDKSFEKVYCEMTNFQSEYMNSVCEDYKKRIDSDAKVCIHELLEYAVNNSVSGNSIISAKTDKLANEIASIIWEEIGEYLLDVQIYNVENEWFIDCMFGGYYVPDWDDMKNMIVNHKHHNKIKEKS